MRLTARLVSRRAAWLAWGFTLLLAALCLALTRLNRLTLDRYVAEFIFSSVFGSLGFATVGALIAVRRPGNRIGWLLSAAGFSAALTAAIQQYARYSLVTQPGALPGGQLLGWLNMWIWVPQTALFLFFLPLLFPTGRMPSPRWRWALWASASGAAAVALMIAITPGPVDSSLPEFSNPYVPPWSAAALPWLAPLATGLVLVSMGAAVAAPLYRMAHSQGYERQQTRVFAFAAAAMALAFLIPIVIYYPNFTRQTFLSGLLLAAGIPIMPIAVGMAVLRYHLYDIDIIVRRTLVYSLLTFLLVLGYFTSVILLQDLLRAVFGASGDLAVVLSTLLMALLFNPLRARVQRVIDRLFYRQRYDPARVLADFSGAVRSEVDLDRLAAILVEQVDEIIQPETISLWIVSQEDGKPRNQEEDS